MNPETPQIAVSTKKTRALTGLMAGETITSAAMSADVSRSTLCRWLLQPDFRQTLTAERSAALSVVGRKLLCLGDAAVDSLASVLATSENDAVRVRAAEAGLNLLLRYAEITDISERLSEVERRLTTAYGRE
jgi:hypothetical protein